MFKKLITKIKILFHIHSHSFGCCFYCASKSLFDKQKESDKHFFIDYGYMMCGKNYIKNCKHARLANYIDSISDIPPDLINAHILLMGIIGAILEDCANKVIPDNEVIKRKYVLIAAFIQGIYICEQSILDSVYLQAGNLIRQEFEILGLINEIKENKRRDGKTVNVKYGPNGGGRLYGELCSIAHLSIHKVIEEVISYQNSWGDYSATIPQHQKDKTIEFYGFHVAMVTSLVAELIYFYGEIFNYKFDKHGFFAIENIIEILKKYKFIFENPELVTISK